MRRSQGDWDVLGRHDPAAGTQLMEGTSWSCPYELSLHAGSAHGASRECAS